MRRRRFVSAALLLLLPTSVPHAQAEEAKPTKLTADLGYVQTSGNSDVVTFSGGDKLEHRVAGWLLLQEGKAVWGETDGTESAGRYEVGLRAERDLAAGISGYLLTAWKRNAFAGVVRQFDEGAGLVWHAVREKPNQLDLELGAGAIQRLNTLYEDASFATGRAAATYRYEFSEKSSLEAGGAYVVNLQDTEDSEASGRLSLTAPVAGRLALKASYDLLYRNRPLPGLEKTDSTFGVGVQASF